jgi:hypothetical protein
MTDFITAKGIGAPTGTSTANFATSHIALGQSEVEQIQLVFPPGCSGLVGARITYGGNPVYPIGPSSWFVFDDYVQVVNPTNQETGGTWAIDVYNTDFYAHTLQAYFYWNYVNLGSSPATVSLVSL